jgi:uncharacterized protein YjbI with pentapeptide repeats
MSPAVTAAAIAAGVSFLTLVGSLVTQFYGIRRTSRDTEKTIASNNEQLHASLAEQRQRLDRTLAEQRERTLNERFATAADRLGSDKPAAVRLAGVYAMAGLADDWAENRQACVDVLCAYLRMPYSPDPGEDAPEGYRLAFLADREVRHTVIRVIAVHLRREALTDWSELHLDFTGVRFDGGDFTSCQFAGKVSFNRARFSAGTVDFTGANFSRGTVTFDRAEFSGGTIDFTAAEFSGGLVRFMRAEFSGGVTRFSDAEFSGGLVDFQLADFSGGQVSFLGARWTGGSVSFWAAKFFGGTVTFQAVNFLRGELTFPADFSGGTVDFEEAEFSGTTVDFTAAMFTGGTVDFAGAEFSSSHVSFSRAKFLAGTIDFSKVAIWSRPPHFDFADNLPAPVRLPPTSVPGGDGSASAPAATHDQIAPS